MCGGAKAKTQIAEIPETQIAEIGGANAKTQIAGSHVSATPQVLRTCGGAGTRDSRPGDSERGVVGGGVWGDLPPASSSAGRDMSRILDEMVLLVLQKLVLGLSAQLVNPFVVLGVIVSGRRHYDRIYYIIL